MAPEIFLGQNVLMEQDFLCFVWQTQTKNQLKCLLSQIEVLKVYFLNDTDRILD